LPCLGLNGKPAGVCRTHSPAAASAASARDVVGMKVFNMVWFLSVSEIRGSDTDLSRDGM